MANQYTHNDSCNDLPIKSMAGLIVPVIASLMAFQLAIPEATPAASSATPHGKAEH